MKKILGVRPSSSLPEGAAFFPRVDPRKSPVAIKAPKNGQALEVYGAEGKVQKQPNLGGLDSLRQVSDEPEVISSEMTSSLPGLLETAPEGFIALAQAPAATSVSPASGASGGSSTGSLAGVSTSTIAAVAAGVVVVGAAAASGGGSSSGDGNSSGGGAKAPAAPTVAGGASGTIAVTIGSDATTAKLYSGSNEITDKFMVSTVGSVVTFRPTGAFDGSTLSVTAKAADAAGNQSPKSGPVSYSHDNVPPPAPTSVVGNPSSGVVTVIFGTSSGEDPSKVKLFAEETDISLKYAAVRGPGLVTYTPIAGEVELTSRTLKATVADASGNESSYGTALALYTFDNAIDITSQNSRDVRSAAGADYVYTVNEGTYDLSIPGFGPGDKIVFKGPSAASISVDNDDWGADSSDGSVLITGNFQGSSGSVRITVEDLSAAQDNEIRSLESFNEKLGTGSLTSVATPPVGPSSSFSITADNASDVHDASGSNVTYTIAEGNYNTTIKNFTKGDSINFRGTSAASLDVDNADWGLGGEDGMILITAIFPDTRNEIGLTVNGLEVLADQEIRSESTFNDAFGVGSLVSTATANPSIQTVAIKPADDGKTFPATGGKFSYEISEGTYSVTINGFDEGDSLSFFDLNEASLSVVNESWGFDPDGVLQVRGVLNEQLVVVTLTEVPLALDEGIRSPESFKREFGSSSLIA